MSGYNIFSQMSGPKIDTDLFARNSSAGIAAGNAQKTETEAIIEGAVEGIQTGQRIVSNQQQIAENEQRQEINQHRIDNLGTEQRIREEQLRGQEIQNDAGQQKLDYDQKRVQRETEFLEAYSNAANDPNAQAQMIMSGQYQDVLAKDPRLWEQVVGQVHAKGGLNDEQATSLRYNARRQGLNDVYDRLEKESELKLNQALELAETNGDLVGYANQLGGVPLLEAAGQITFTKDGMYDVVNGKRAPIDPIKRMDGTVPPPRTGMYQVWDKQGNYLGEIDDNGRKVIESVKYHQSNLKGIHRTKGLKDLEDQFKQKTQPQPQGPQQPAAPSKPAMAPKVDRGPDRVKVIDPKGDVAGSPEVKAASTELLGIKPETYDAHKSDFDEINKELYEVAKTPEGFFDASIAALSRTPTEKQQTLKSASERVQRIMAKERVQSALKTPVGRDLYSPEGVALYNQEVEARQEAVLFKEMAAYGGIVPPTLIGNRREAYLSRLRENGVQGITKVATPEEMYYERNRGALKTAGDSYVNSMTKRYSDIQKSPEHKEALRVQKIQEFRKAGEASNKPAIQLPQRQAASGESIVDIAVDAPGSEPSQVEMLPVNDTSARSNYTPSEAVQSLENVDLSEYDDIIEDASAAYGVDAALIRAVILKESAGKVDAESSAGAKGLMQVTPIAAKDVGMDKWDDPVNNIKAGTKYLAKMIKLHKGNLGLALAAYNAGPGKSGKRTRIPEIPETQEYVDAVRYLYTQNVKGRSATT